MNKWKEVKLGDEIEVTDYVANGSFASLKQNVKYSNEENYAILLRLCDFHNKWKGNFIYVDKNSYEFLKKTKVYPDDVIISNVGVNVGTVFKAPKLNKPMTLGPNSILLKCSNNIIKKYIYYYFLSSIGQNKISSIVTGSAQPKFNKTDFRNIKIKLPPLPIQKKIADILSVIDEKIETLQNINSTLEEMAKTIFKSWFVDFDIVKAKEEGKSDSEIAKEFGINEDIVKLFPSEFEESEIGKIPKGWEVRKLGDFFPIKTGKKNANIATNNGKYPFFTCSQEILKTNSYSFNDNAILLAGNGDFNIKWYRGKFEAYQRTYVLIPYEKINLGYLFFSMKYFLDLITGASQGSVIKFITKGMIENFKIVYPDNNKFITFFNQILNNLESNTQQIQTLQELRDTLLPKLIKGEIEVDKLNIKGFE